MPKTENHILKLSILLRISKKKLKTTIHRKVNGDLISTQNTHEEIKWVDSDLVSKHKADHVYATH